MAAGSLSVDEVTQAMRVLSNQHGDGAFSIPVPLGVALFGKGFTDEKKRASLSLSLKVSSCFPCSRLVFTCANHNTHCLGLYAGLC